MGIHCPILTHQILLSVLDSVINKADKGSTIVILTRSDYIHRGMNHLADEATYEPLLEDISGELKTNINHQLHKLYTNGLLTEPMYKFCQPPLQSRTSRLYFLQKIHKNPMGIRPIVSSCKSITENISEFVDFWLQPLMKNLLSFIKDSTEFINLIERTSCQPIVY